MECQWLTLNTGPLYRQDFRKSALLLWYPSVWLITQPRGTFTSNDVWPFQKGFWVFRTEWWEWHLVGRGQRCCWPSYNWTVLWEAFPGKLPHECLPTPDREPTTKKWLYRRAIWWAPGVLTGARTTRMNVHHCQTHGSTGYDSRSCTCILCSPYTSYKLENTSLRFFLSNLTSSASTALRRGPFGFPK